MRSTLIRIAGAVVGWVVGSVFLGFLAGWVAVHTDSGPGLEKTFAVLGAIGGIIGGWMVASALAGKDEAKRNLVRIDRARAGKVGVLSPPPRQFTVAPGSLPSPASSSPSPAASRALGVAPSPHSNNHGQEAAAGLAEVRTEFHVALLDRVNKVGILIVPPLSDDRRRPGDPSLHELDNEKIRNRLAKSGWYVQTDEWAQASDYGRFHGYNVRTLGDGRQLQALDVQRGNGAPVEGEALRRLIEQAERLSPPAIPSVKPEDYENAAELRWGPVPLPEWTKHLQWVADGDFLPIGMYLGRTVYAGYDPGYEFSDDNFLASNSSWAMYIRSPGAEFDTAITRNYASLNEAVVAAAQALPPRFDDGIVSTGFLPIPDWQSIEQYRTELARSNHEDGLASRTIEVLRQIGFDLADDVETFRDLRICLSTMPQHWLVSRTLLEWCAEQDRRDPEEPRADEVPTYRQARLGTLAHTLREQEDFATHVWPRLQAGLHLQFPEWIPGQPLHSGERLAQLIELPSRHLDSDLSADMSAQADLAADVREHLGAEPAPEDAVWRVDVGLDRIILCEFFRTRQDALEFYFEFEFATMVHIDSEIERRAQLAAARIERMHRPAGSEQDDSRRTGSEGLDTA